MEWSCSKCTFLNPLSQKSLCQICLTPKTQPSSSSSSSPSPSRKNPQTISLPSPPKWSCTACTFLNQPRSTSCHVCASSKEGIAYALLEDDEVDASVGSVFFPLRRCGNRGKGREETGSSAAKGVVEKEKNMVVELDEMDVEDTQPSIEANILKIMSYNVWFREDLEMHQRMKSIGELIKLHNPHIICLQEVTPDIYDIFKSSSWWNAYDCSMSHQLVSSRAYFCLQLSRLPVKGYRRKPFRNSMMGRELCSAEINIGDGTQLVVATSHLESPCPAPPKFDQMYSKERVTQANESIAGLKDFSNVIFCGDMNWDDKGDGAFPLPDGWHDAWTELRPTEDGWTYDTKRNEMLSANRKLQKRLDRFICKLNDFEMKIIEMIGTDPIPGLSYRKEKRARNASQTLSLPVLPSDHYGLVLQICRKTK